MDTDLPARATAVAHPNIAFIKYWGHLELRAAQRQGTPNEPLPRRQNLPANASISMTLGNARTTTTVAFREGISDDAFTLNGAPADGAATLRVSRHLDRVRQLAGVKLRAVVASENSFPADVGIASSASGFAALTLAATAALGLSLSPRELSLLARLASGSACRSIHGGYVEWLAGARHEDSFARQIAPPDHWDLVDVVAVVSREVKEVSSLAGHALAPTSPFHAARLGALHAALARARTAILQRDLATLGEVAEADALALHAVAMTSQPGALYWLPATVTLIHAVRRWRREGLPAYFTIDAGPNVHIITERVHAEEVQRRLRGMRAVLQTIVCPAGPDAHLVAEHLF